jgi:uncharacterized protein YecE (DUF72 family)
MASIRIGTSAFTAAGWESAFYPPGMKPTDYLTYYATKFNTVEVDSTFYRTPSVATVNGWERKTPEGFSLAAKVPQVITHEKCLLDCEDDLKRFVETMDLMGAHRVAYALIDQAWMPLASEIFQKFDPITADFTYIRLLGDRKGIEKQTKIWDKVIVDRSRELMIWVNVCQRTVRRGVTTYIYVNNHYAGFAPGTIEQFQKLWKAANL